MINKTKIALIALFVASGSAGAVEVNFAPRIDVGTTKYTLDLSNSVTGDQSYDVDFNHVTMGVSILSGGFVFDITTKYGFNHSDASGPTSLLVESHEIEGGDSSISLGYELTPSTKLFAGYRTTWTELTEVRPDVIDLDGATPELIQNLNDYYAGTKEVTHLDSNGLFGGISYSVSLANEWQLSLSGAATSMSMDPGDSDLDVEQGIGFALSAALSYGHLYIKLENQNLSYDATKNDNNNGNNGIFTQWNGEGSVETNFTRLSLGYVF